MNLKNFKYLKKNKCCIFKLFQDSKQDNNWIYFYLIS